MKYNEHRNWKELAETYWESSDEQDALEVTNPANQQLIAKIKNFGYRDCKSSIDRAHAALASWRDRTAYDRSRLMKKWFSLVKERRNDLAMIMTMEQGKPLSEAKGEITYSSSFIRWFAEEGIRAYGETIPAPAASSRFVTIRQSVGVVAAITPWNFPSAMITRKLAPALAAGCTVVVKPSEETPLSALALASLAEEAGIPKGVVNVVTPTDPEEFSKAVFEDSEVRKISFTGSIPVGKKLMAAAAKTVKKISLELGGNAPFIVFEDADIKRAVSGLMTAKFRNNGQACIAANRIFLHESIYGEFMELFEKKVRELKVGPGMESQSDLGPLINKAACKKASEMVEEALEKGARLRYRGQQEADGSLFYPPVILENCTEEMRVFKEEIFGPVAAVSSFKDGRRVIEQANDTQSGLAAYFYSRDISRCWICAEELEYGMVGVNSGFISDASAPFGGIKESGIGREGSRYGLEEYMEIKYMSFGGIKK